MLEILSEEDIQESFAKKKSYRKSETSRRILAQSNTPNFFLGKLLVPKVFLAPNIGDSSDDHPGGGSLLEGVVGVVVLELHCGVRDTDDVFASAGELAELEHVL